MNNIANLIEINSTGAQIDDAVNKKHEHIMINTVFVDSSSADGGNGTLAKPYNNLQIAVNSAPFGSNIRLEAGLYQVANRLLTIKDKDNIALISDGVGAVLDGDLLITGTSTETFIKNLRVNGNYTYNSTQSYCYIDNMYINGLVHLVSTGYHSYKNVFFHNMLVEGSVFLDMKTSKCDDNSVWTVNGVNATMSILDCLNAKYEHLNGNMFLDGFTNVLPVGNNVGILSTSNNGVLRIGNISMLQANGQYASIQKTGNCSYLIGLLSYDPSNSVLNGTAIRKSGIQAEQVFKDGSNLVQVLENINTNLVEALEAVNTNLLEALEEVNNKIPKLIQVVDEAQAITASTANPNNIYFWV